MKYTYKSLFTGNNVLVSKLTMKLKEIGIIPIIKDYNESGRVAGFGQMIPGQQEVVVSEDEYDKALEILGKVVA